MIGKTIQKLIDAVNYWGTFYLSNLFITIGAFFLIFHLYNNLFFSLAIASLSTGLFSYMYLYIFGRKIS